MRSKRRSKHKFNDSGKEHVKKKYRATSQVPDCRANKSLCTAIGSFSHTACTNLYSFVPIKSGNENEVAGPLVLKKQEKQRGKHPCYEIDVDKKGVKGGNSKEVDAIDSKYNFHSHPEAAYVAHNCELGWPSRDDYITFLDGFFKVDTTFHVIATKEGVYILKINPCAIEKIRAFYKKLGGDKEKFINNVDDWADEFINISKIGLTRANGKPAPKTGETIRTPKEYVNFVNNVSCDEIKCNGKTLKLEMPIFDIEYISWKDTKKSSFIFTVEKSKDGACKIIG